MLRIRMIAAAILAAGTLALVAAPAGAAGAIKPVLQCVFADEKAGTYVAVWGYENNNKEAIEVPIAEDNVFDPRPQDRGQPTKFEPGIKTNAFTTVWGGTTKLTWKLNGSAVTASLDSERCKEPPVPQGNDSPQALLLIAVAAGVVMLGSAASGWVIHRRRRSV
jgi:hypothetical protein